MSAAAAGSTPARPQISDAPVVRPRCIVRLNSAGRRPGYWRSFGPPIRPPGGGGEQTGRSTTPRQTPAGGHGRMTGEDQPPSSLAASPGVGACAQVGHHFRSTSTCGCAAFEVADLLPVRGHVLGMPAGFGSSRSPRSRTLIQPPTSAGPEVSQAGLRAGRGAPARAAQDLRRDPSVTAAPRVEGRRYDRSCSPFIALPG